MSFENNSLPGQIYGLKPRLSFLPESIASPQSSRRIQKTYAMAKKLRARALPFIADALIPSWFTIISLAFLYLNYVLIISDFLQLKGNFVLGQIMK